MDNEQKPVETEDVKAPAESGASDSVEGADAGTRFVEFENPEVEARFKRIYGHMKQYERAVDQMSKDNRALIEKVEKIEAGAASQAANDQLTILRGRKVKALQDADFEAVAKIDDQLLDMKVKTAPKTDQKPETPADGVDLSQWLTKDEENDIVTWAQEKDASGKFVREWATNLSHPKHVRGREIAVAVVSDPDFQGKPVSEILAEVDRLMGEAPKATRPAASVLTGNMNQRQRAGDTPLNEQQKFVAEKMGMTPQRYQAAVKKWGPTA